MNISEIDLATLNWKPNVMAGDLCPFCKKDGGMEYAAVEDIQVEKCCCGNAWTYTDETGSES